MPRHVLLLSLLSATTACINDNYDDQPLPAATDTSNEDTSGEDTSSDTAAGETGSEDTAAVELAPEDTLVVNVGTEGATIEHPLVTVEIPADAVEADVTITPLTEGIGGLGALAHPFTIDFGGAEVMQPITLTVALPEAMPDAPLYLWTVDGTRHTVQAEVLEQAPVLTIEADTTIAMATTGTHTDAFAPAGAEADFLLVIDNSGSMGEEQEDISDAASDFFDLLDATPLDYHLGVTDTDCDATNNCGELYTYSGNDWVEPTTLEAQGVFEGMIDSLSVDGSATERGFRPVDRALGTNATTGFRRTDARLEVFWVSDEPEQSGEDPTKNEMVTTLQDAVSDDSHVRAHAIVGPIPSGCSGTTGAAGAGPRYHAVVDDIGGTTSSICDDVSDAMVDAMRSMVVTECHELSYAPDLTTVVVQSTPSGHLVSPDNLHVDATGTCIELTMAGYEELQGESMEISYDVGTTSSDTGGDTGGDTADSGL